MVLENLSPTCKSSNPTHQNSKWGALANTLYDRNTYQDRKFLQQLFTIRSLEKYHHTTPSEILTATSTINNFQLLPNNFSHQNSRWGKLSEIMYASNTHEDRKFLHSLWNVIIQADNMSIKIINDPGSSSSQLLDSRRPGNLQGLPTSLPASSSRKRDSSAKQLKVSTSTRKKIHYNMNRQEILHRQISRRLSITHSPPTVQLNPQTDLITQLCTNFTHQIWQFPTFPCTSCDKVIYPKKKENYTVTAKLSEILETYGHQI